MIVDQLSLPYRRHSDTSREAAEAAQEGAATQRGKVLAYLHSYGGHTDEEIQVGLAMNPSTERPRRIELVQMGRVRDSGRVRHTKSGRNAVVWEWVPET